MGRVSSGYFHKPSSRRFSPIELISIVKQQALSPERDQMKGSKGTEIQKSHFFADFQMEVNPTEASASAPEMEVGHTEASPSVSRMAEKNETEEKKSLVCHEANNFFNHSINPCSCFSVLLLYFTIFLEQSFKNF
jgi:hypothetical protein